MSADEPKSYKVVLEGHTTDINNRGRVSKILEVNKPPKPGKCSVSPKDGVPLKTEFEVSCEGFNDDEEPLQYEFFYSKGGNNTFQSLGAGVKPTRSRILLPSCAAKDVCKIYFSVHVSDRLGAVKKYSINSTVKVS